MNSRTSVDKNNTSRLAVGGGKGGNSRGGGVCVQWPVSQLIRLQGLLKGCCLPAERNDKEKKHAYWRRSRQVQEARTQSITPYPPPTMKAEPWPCLRRYCCCCCCCRCCRRRCCCIDKSTLLMTHRYS